MGDWVCGWVYVGPVLVFKGQTYSLLLLLSIGLPRNTFTFTLFQLGIGTHHQMQYRFALFFFFLPNQTKSKFIYWFYWAQDDLETCLLLLLTCLKYHSAFLLVYLSQPKRWEIGRPNSPRDRSLITWGRGRATKWGNRRYDFVAHAQFSMQGNTFHAPISKLSFFAPLFVEVKLDCPPPPAVPFYPHPPSSWLMAGPL